MRWSQRSQSKVFPQPAMLAVTASLAAGAAVVIQNAVLAAIAARGLGLTGALLCNALVGTSLLVTAWGFSEGPRAASLLLGRAEIWFLVPGLLGTAFVFASLYGYRQQGATPTVALIVASQLATGLLLDALGVTAGGRALSLDRLLGVALLLTGAVLVVRGKTFT